MKSAYNETWLYNLSVIKESKRWLKHSLITQDQFGAIRGAYPSSFYHPNFIIRILLFLATLLALSGVTGLLVIIVIDSASKEFLSIASIIYGLISFVVLEKVFIQNSKHYKSGVTEALLYHAMGFTLLGISDFNEHLILWFCLAVFMFSAIRYLDLLSTVAAMGCFAAVLFFEFYSWGGIFQQLIPFLFMAVFSGVYFLTRWLKSHDCNKRWMNNLLIVEAVSLLLIYAGGNYFVVRELSESMMGLTIEPGSDIPFAFFFYTLTVLIPVTYLFVGIRRKDVALLRVSLIVIAFSAFTFKYYFSFGHPEITLTVAGIVLLVISIALLNFLKVMRSGFTRENLLTEKWGNSNVEAFVISQTVGGNQSRASGGMGGGDSGGGGAGTEF